MVVFDDNVLDRYSLAIERIAEINSECEIKNNKHKDYFNKVSAFILLMDKLKNDVADDAFNSMSLEELSEYNHRLYEDVADSAYDTSYANPRVCAKAFGEDAGKLMAMVYMELRALIVYMYEKRFYSQAIFRAGQRTCGVKSKYHHGRHGHPTHQSSAGFPAWSLRLRGMPSPNI